MKKTRHEEAVEKMNELDNKGIKYERLEKYPLYRIYENGEIIKDKSNINRNDLKHLKHTLSPKGYHTVYVFDKEMTGSSQRVHRLVAKCFVSGEDDINNIVNHKDGNKNNNHYNNLEWCDIKYNNKHAIETLGVKRCGENNGYSKVTDEEVRNMRYLYSISNLNYRQIGDIYGISKTTATSIIQGKSWKHVKEGER